VKGPAVVTVVLAGMGLAGQAVADPTPLQGVARFHGTADNDYLTYSMAGGGDVDGDGYDDLALGATGSDVGGSSRGAVYLFLGSEDGWAGDVDAATADAWWYGVGMNLGTAVAVAPDVNGDGYDDLLMSAGGDGVSNAGKVYLVLGRESGWAPSQSAAVADASWQGEGAFYHAGTALAGVGDVDGDGLGDLLIGDSGGPTYAGQAYLVLGRSSGWALDESTSAADLVLRGEGASDNAGATLAGGGDLDGDGLADMVVSAYGWNDDRGKIYVVFGDTGGWPDELELSAADGSFQGEDEDDYAGLGLAVAGDVDGDGYDDALIGAYDRAADSAGIVYLVLGRSSGWASNVPLQYGADASFVGEVAGDSLGHSVDGAGDVNADGLADILIGATGTDDPEEHCGSALVFLGRTTGFGWDTPASEADGWYAGASENESMGTVVAGIGDADGDGYDDLLIGSRYNDDFGDDHGVAVVVPGYNGQDLDGDGWTSWTGDCDDTDPTLNRDDLDGDGVDTCEGDCDDTDPALENLDQDGDGIDTCEGDCDDLDWYVGPNSPELCNGLDDDCDGSPASYEQDLDGDGYMACAECDDTDAAVYPGAADPCDGVDGDCADDLADTEVDDDLDGFSECEGDCDDTDGAVYPGAAEVCNDGLDDDCDPDTDETADADGDGHGPCDEVDPDCDDDDPAIHPGAEEICDGIDQDCDGVADDIDEDFDGFSPCGGDCDDADPGINVGAEEIPYDGIDQDCDGSELYDVDGDGFDGGGGGDDCDDADPAIHLGADEVPYDGVDQDCDGTDLLDVDGDGFEVFVDCHDRDPAIYPGAGEHCGDGVDNDCDQLADGWDPDCHEVPQESVEEGCACRLHGRHEPAPGTVLLLLGLVLARRRSRR